MKRLTLIPVVVIASFAMAQQSAQQPKFVNADEARLVPVAGLPECASFAVEHGDPKGASSVTLVKLVRGCTVPMHWHSANEQLLFVSGTAQVDMPGEQPHTLKAGGYYFMPAHHQHQLSCPSGCTIPRVMDGPIDIHYVNAAGIEIPAEKALAAFGERPATPLPPK